MKNYFTAEPMKYWSMSATISQTERKMKLEQMMSSNEYLFGLKTDGNDTRAVITNDRAALQTRGISVKTKTYGEVQEKVMFWNDVLKAFEGKGTTVILGETYLDGGIDADVGSILRCLPAKAIARQKDKPLKWRIFDVLCYKDEELINTPFEERIKYIPKVVKEINSPLVRGVSYYEMDETFFDKMGDIFAAGGEGAVCYKKSALYEFGKRGPHAWDSVKVKQEISTDLDVLILSTVECEKNYNGGDLPHWQFWENIRSGEKVCGDYFGEYQLGGAYIPVSKNYYYNWPGAIMVGVYNNSGKLIPLCKVAGLTETFKSELRDNFDEWYLCPISISGMMVSTANAAADGTGISIRHPIIKSIRREDIDPKDCLLSKIVD